MSEFVSRRDVINAIEETDCGEVNHMNDIISRQAAIEEADDLVEPQESEG